MRPICLFADISDRVASDSDFVYYRCKAMPFSCSCTGLASCVRYRPFEGQTMLDFNFD